MDTALAPGYVRVTYNGALFPHHQVIPVNYDGTPTPGSEPDVVLKDASTTNVEDAINGLITLEAPFFNAVTGFGLAEAHAVDADTGLDTFLWAWDVGVNGSNVNPQIATEQIVFSFKTTIGSAYKLYMMEAALEPNLKTLPPFVDVSVNALSDYITGDSSPIYGRKNAYPFVPVSFITKYNDKLRKQQGLS